MAVAREKMKTEMQRGARVCRELDHKQINAILQQHITNKYSKNLPTAKCTIKNLSKKIKIKTNTQVSKITNTESSDLNP